MLNLSYIIKDLLFFPLRAELKRTKLKKYLKEICESERRAHLRNQGYLKKFECVQTYIEHLTTNSEKLQKLKVASCFLQCVLKIFPRSVAATFSCLNRVICYCVNLSNSKVPFRSQFPLWVLFFFFLFFCLFWSGLLSSGQESIRDGDHWGVLPGSSPSCSWPRGIVPAVHGFLLFWRLSSF